jgi:hypothetical protein
VIGHAGQTFFEAHEAGGPGTPLPIDSYTWQWRGRQVFPVGGVLLVSSSGQPVDVTISGYALTP